MIKLKNGKEYEELFVDLQGDSLVVAIKAAGLKYDDIEVVFKQPEVIRRIELIHQVEGEQTDIARVWEDYTQVLSIEKHFDYPDNLTTVDVFFVVLSQDNSMDMIKKVKSNVEESNNDIMLALTEVYEMLLAQEV